MYYNIDVIRDRRILFTRGRVDPYGYRDLYKYYEDIKEYNNALQSTTKSYLVEIYRYLKHNNGLAFYTCGSDGRKEKCTHSCMELKIVYEGNNLLDNFLSSEISMFISFNTNRHIYMITELKNLNKGPFLTYSNTSRYFPSRVYDMVLLVGDDFLDRIKEKTNIEIKKYYSKIRKQIKDRRKEAKRIILKGENRIRSLQIRHFDIEKGILYYLPCSSDNKVWALSTKQGHLRFVQYFVEYGITKGIYENRVDLDEILKDDFLKRTSERLRYLRDNKILNISNENIEEIIEHYLYFLNLYHRSQYSYLFENRSSVYIDDVKEFKARSESLIDLLSGNVFKDE